MGYSPDVSADETVLVHAAQQGDLESFNLLVLKYQDMLYRIALRILHDEFTAQDAVQDALILAFRNLRSFRGGSLRSWLARVTVNASYDELRRRKRYAAQPIELLNNDGDEIESPAWIVDLSAGPEEMAEIGEMREAIRRCIQALSPDYRLAVILVDMEGLSYEEAARVARIPVGTVKSRLARARMQICNRLRSFRDLLPGVYQSKPALAAHVT
jgi:RNA polymerase sigma-70 factor (ECF subfamily)